MSVRVAIPVYFASLTVYFEKGRRWNAVEHALLYAVCQEPLSASQLAAVSSLEFRVVIEVMIRLMRAGWVELESSSEGLHFLATAAGKMNVEHDDLPAITSPKKRKASYVIERSTGAIFRARDLILYNKHDYKKLNESNAIIEFPPSGIEPSIRLDQIISTLLNEDEECKHVEAAPGRVGEKFAIVSVIGESIEGLPLRAPAKLREMILLASKTQQPLIVEKMPEHVKKDDISNSSLNIRFDPRDFIVGAKEHEELLKFSLKKARSRIIIHSTFIDIDRFRTIYPLLHDAAKRGVKIDILWGKSDTGNDTDPMRLVLEKCKAMLLGDDVNERITLHGFTTNSHAKILIADNEKGKMIAVLGSCNWLSTGFTSIEASVRLEHPAIVSQIVSHIGKMAAAPGKGWTVFEQDLSVIAARLSTTQVDTVGIGVNARLVFGAEHSYFVRKARDDAQVRIVIASHRFNQNAETLVLIPTKAAIKAKDIEVKLYYGQLDGHSDGLVAAAIAEKARGEGIRHEQIINPRLHAKVLAWDSDSVVVSSQNWLSADPNDNDMYSEIGIYLDGPKLADEMVHLLNGALPYNG